MFLKTRTVNVFAFLFVCFFHAGVYASSAEIVALAGDQRMHVQLLAKSYLYAHGEVFADKAQKNLKNEYREYGKNNDKLRALVKGAEHSYALSRVNVLDKEFVGLLNSEEYTDNDASIMIGVSEDLAGVYDDIVQKELKKTQDPNIKFLELLEQQAMLVAKMAKFYVAYTMGLNDANTLKSIKDSVEKFDRNHKLIIKQKSKISSSKKDLKKITKTWRTMKGYYTGIEESQLPAMVMITTDRILKSLGNIIDAFIKQEKL